MSSTSLLHSYWLMNVGLTAALGNLLIFLASLQAMCCEDYTENTIKRRPSVGGFQSSTSASYFITDMLAISALGSCPSLILFQPNFETFLLYIADISWNGNDEIPLCIRSRKRASRGSTNYPPPAVDEFLRNLIKFPVWVFDIYGAERPAYCMQDSFHCDNF
ncbi:hypothetical protein T4D_338 [Trichinella pseudospiralis]|uniref:Uncharacterized protein n=1 Tax=Trichinella pseudospiralis TaxID=6337 RepID=A0A0V1F4B5_TRIPS|nr:hypothetical protein T4D_14019 [Trichinella pseudospiralis]KRY80776.1 hypothetical protein T4D_338 [Trichinella pseudospiralis]